MEGTEGGAEAPEGDVEGQLRRAHCGSKGSTPNESSLQGSLVPSSVGRRGPEVDHVLGHRVISLAKHEQLVGSGARVVWVVEHHVKVVLQLVIAEISQVGVSAHCLTPGQRLPPQQPAEEVHSVRISGKGEGTLLESYWSRNPLHLSRSPSKGLWSQVMSSNEGSLVTAAAAGDKAAPVTLATYWVSSATVRVIVAEFSIRVLRSWICWPKSAP